METACSLLAAVSLFDHSASVGNAKNPACALFIPLVKRYWNWLKGRKITVLTAEGRKLTGWHSEHVNDPSFIHTWETSQVLEFLVVFRDQMMRYVASTMLNASRLSIKQPGAMKPWDKILLDFEPTPTWPPEDQVFLNIGKEFIGPHSERDVDATKWSMLLYGPPGTGKSALAENIAGCLRAPLITITVGDFLAQGETEMENRAKLVFEALNHQIFSVVLFDEMDQFMLDRDSALFREQATAFQFLTPGMLTKFAELRKRRNLIFIIATNYEERIDSAIKRTGRIDQKYIVLPPNARKRLAILGDERLKHTNAIVKALDKNEIERVIAHSAFLGYKDLEWVSQARPKNFAELIEKLRVAPRNIRFGAYVERFAHVEKDGDKYRIDLTQGPLEELVCVCKLAAEAWSDRDQHKDETSEKFKEALKDLWAKAQKKRVLLERVKDILPTSAFLADVFPEPE